ncbi:uncharacterized protein LOC134239285, partial [Saccostrea cucullata]|uniref:uncharacterized protein LOC134239285 n=1 Tax=Saccostrea cuccullata TaxID=36930 RepID=UPI002ED2B684
CLEGYFGLNCSQLCPYPSYGKGCKETCDCSKPFCVPTLGCATKENKNRENFITTKANYGASLEENSTLVTKWEDSTPNNNVRLTTKVPTSTYLFVAILVAVVFLITVSILQMVFKRKVSRNRQVENNSSEVPQTGNINSRQSERVSNIYDSICENPHESSQSCKAQSKKSNYLKKTVQKRYSDAANEYLDTRAVGFELVRESNHFYSPL